MAYNFEDKLKTELFKKYQVLQAGLCEMQLVCTGFKSVKQTNASATRINWSVPVVATVDSLVKISSHYYTYKISA